MHVHLNGNTMPIIITIISNILILTKKVVLVRNMSTVKQFYPAVNCLTAVSYTAITILSTLCYQQNFINIVTFEISIVLFEK